MGKGQGCRKGNRNDDYDMMNTYFEKKPLRQSKIGMMKSSMNLNDNSLDMLD